jgi:hypothetical protein
LKPLPTGIELDASIIAVSQGLVVAKFYQTILARLTVRAMRGLLPRITEFALRAMPIVALPTTLLAESWRPDLWPWTCAAGAVSVTAANFVLLRLAQNTLAHCEGKLSSTPPGARVSSHGYEQWWWTMFLYAVVIGVIATGLQTGFLKDQSAYVFGLTLISVGIHYASKCVVAGSAIRGELARAFCAGERLNILEFGRPGRSKLAILWANLLWRVRSLPPGLTAWLTRRLPSRKKDSG